MTVIILIALSVAVGSISTTFGLVRTRCLLVAEGAVLQQSND